MSEPLYVCARCQRHVKAHETRCPFCEAELPPREAAGPKVTARLSRAAALPLGPALEEGESAEQPAVEAYGGPPPPAPSFPTLGRRFARAAGATGVLVLGALALFILIVIDDETRSPGGFGGKVPFLAFAVVSIGAVLIAGGLFGRAVVPAAVIARGSERPFVRGMALAGAAMLLVLPTQLSIFSWPLAALSAVLSFVFFRQTRGRPPPPAR